MRLDNIKSQHFKKYLAILNEGLHSLVFICVKTCLEAPGKHNQ